MVSESGLLKRSESYGQKKKKRVHRKKQTEWGEKKREILGNIMRVKHETG